VRVEVAPDAPDLRYTLNLPSVEVETALDALCEGAGIRWQKVEGGYRIAPISPPQARPAAAPAASVPASPRAASASPRTAPSRLVAPDQPLRCPNCRYALQLDWRYCPICGAFVKHLTDRAKRGQQRGSR
ncbi:MAG: zinc ribbon domain-containing protein, partial [Fimbriimonadales bacterium]|nr:zinc ribbon domain-containing protein [Fimbriimonadales bacterium]